MTKLSGQRFAQSRPPNTIDMLGHDFQHNNIVVLRLNSLLLAAFGRRTCVACYATKPVGQLLLEPIVLLGWEWDPVVLKR